MGVFKGFYLKIASDYQVVECSVWISDLIIQESGVFGMDFKTVFSGCKNGCFQWFLSNYSI